MFFFVIFNIFLKFLDIAYVATIFGCWKFAFLCDSHISNILTLLGIPGFPPGMPYGFVRIFFFFFFFFFFFLFFRRQGFRMITFDRQAGPLQNFNRSHIMVIGRSVGHIDHHQHHQHI